MMHVGLNKSGFCAFDFFEHYGLFTCLIGSVLMQFLPVYTLQSPLKDFELAIDQQWRIECNRKVVTKKEKGNEREKELF